MLHALVLVAGLLARTAPARADDALAAETVAAVKAASVYVRVEGDGWGGSGSGFVVAADKDRVLVVTNHHVAVKVPAGARPKPPVVTVVFGSGTRAERECPATVVAADEDRDLAVLRVAAVKDAPLPIAFANPPKPFETMSVYSFGFPLGQALSVGKGFPAVTVGKASVSSLREGDDGELAVVQIDGNLNPGNSGGPVVDAKGRLVGVAVARAKEGQGIGFLVPAAEVERLMAGRVGRVRVAVAAGADGKPSARVTADVIDPAGAVRGATAYCVVVPPKGKAPDAAALDKHPDARKVALKIENGVAAGEVGVEKAEGLVMVQVVADRGPGADAAATRPRGFSLAPPPKPGDLAGPPPAGWKEYTAPNRAFVVWVPEKPTRQGDERRAVTVAGEALAAVGVGGKTEDGLTYRAEVITLPPVLTRAGAGLYPAVRNALREETKGRITEAAEAQAGGLVGAEYRIEAGAEVTRVRAFILANRVYLVRVSGAAAAVAGAEAETVLASFHRPGDVARVPEVATTVPKLVPSDKGPVIFGTDAHHPKFRGVGPDGAVLVGVEVRFGKFGSTDIVRAVRPIYRVAGKEEFGKQIGDDLTGSVTVKAKDGYAVGGLTAKYGWWCNGFSLTFMKVKPDGTLDPKDSYESTWAGFTGKGDTGRVLSDGPPVVGVVGRIAGTETYSLGLVFKGQEALEVNTAGEAPAAVVVVEPKLIVGGKEPTILGSIAHDPKFKTVGPEGAVLVGVEVRFGKFGATDIARAVRPIYRVGGKEEFGKQFGDDLTGSVTLKARDGYAVGGVTGKAGWWCNGFSLTFMKVKPDGTLDPKDSYESDWAGFNGKSDAFKVVTDGPPAVGIVGKIVGSETTAFGLLFKGQEGFDPSVTAAPRRPEQPAANRGPRIQGRGAQEVRSLAPEGGVLVGLEFGLGKFVNRDIIVAVRPVYRVGEKDVPGDQFGTDTSRPVRVLAKPGYAVGAVAVRTGLNLDGVTVTFMKLVDGKLDPKDSYEGETVCDKGGTRLGDGSPIVGLLAVANARSAVTGLGVIYPDTAKDNAPWPAGKPGKILGGGDAEFRVAGPAGSLLVGLEVGLAKGSGGEVVRACRPVYRAGDKDSVGEWVGVESATVVKVVAKPGYAVGALSTKGLFFCDGLSVTFMKVVDGKLDPKDSYESEWVGSKGGAGPTTSGGDGTLVVGVVGRKTGKDIAAWGVLLKEPDKK
ncbi:S1C family serine protease [Gemmata sp.]|uniref:S1C family serine protease n=1 Tax=Gemmata sp. TaxID=1914242 RepID=UPI003F721317